MVSQTHMDSPKNVEAVPLGSASKLQASSTRLAIRAFLLTVSVKGDLSKDSEDKIVKWIRKNALMFYAVAETGESGRRHLHACLVFKDPRDPKQLKDNVWHRFVKDHHPDSLPRIAVKVQACPGNKWYDEYLKKEKDVDVLLDNWNREEAEDYFPTEQTQQALRTLASRKGEACPWLTEDVLNWEQSTFENTPEGAGMYLKHRMYVARNMVPIGDPKKLAEKAVVYWNYRNRVFSLSERELWMIKQNQDGPSYDPVCRASNSAAPPSI